MIVHKLPKQLVGLIFDMDQTLYRHEEYYSSQMKNQVILVAQSLGKSVEQVELDLETGEKDFILRNNGKKPSFGNLLLQVYGIPITQSVELRQKAICPEKYLSKDLLLIETLNALEKVYRFVLLTNNPKDIAQRTLKVLGVERFFPKIIGLDESGHSKPHPRPFELAVKALALDPKVCLSIGDRFPVDLEVPLAMGMGAILVEDMKDIYDLPEVLSGVSTSSS